MVLSMDPETAVALAAQSAEPDDVPAPAVGDVATRRALSAERWALLAPRLPQVDEVARQDHTMITTDGAEVLLRWYSPPDVAGRADGTGGAAVLHLHGGGMIMGSVERDDAATAALVASSGVPMLAVEYRLAPESPHPVPVEDCYAALVWLVEHAGSLGVDPARVAVMGESAGGGLAAGVALLAQDRSGPAIARQILVYPMLDDRTTEPDPRFDGLTTWSYADNLTGWQALLTGAAGTDDVSPYAAPARAADLSGLPPAYLDVGDLDIFLDEDLAYAARLAAAGVPVELHVLPGAPHGFEGIAPASALTERARADRVRALRSV